MGLKQGGSPAFFILSTFGYSLKNTNFLFYVKSMFPMNLCVLENPKSIINN